MSQKRGMSSKLQEELRSGGLSPGSVMQGLILLGHMRIVGASIGGDVLTFQSDGFEGTFSLDSEEFLDLISSGVRMGWRPYLGFQVRH
jgi:hypothetical protein